MSEKNTRKVVSANYLNRENQDFRWLVRFENEGREGLLPVQSLYATGVTFGDGTFETGFGCGTVAYCENVVYDQPAPADLKIEKLRFEGYYFFNSKTGDRVRSCDHLILTKDGSMFMATSLPTAKPTTKPVREPAFVE